VAQAAWQRLSSVGVLLAAGTDVDPDQRILKMLGARDTVVAQPSVVRTEAEELEIVN
jgi:hypothetical protein